MVSPLLRHLGRVSYGAFLPLEDLSGAENYLVDVWKHFPRSVALAHTVLCLGVYFLPVFTYLRPLSLLPSKARDQYVQELLNSRVYLFRLIGFGVKGHALVAILRVKNARESLAKTSDIAGARRAV